MCPSCQRAYEQWARTLDAEQSAAYDMVQDKLPEPCGQQFPDEPPAPPF
jgi:hypothetical protein